MSEVFLVSLILLVAFAGALAFAEWAASHWCVGDDHVIRKTASVVGSFASGRFGNLGADLVVLRHHDHRGLHRPIAPFGQSAAPDSLGCHFGWIICHQEQLIRSERL
jgi:hypothetical protein